MGKLDGKVAVITGSARGIGKEIALTFAREGADIVVNDILVAEMESTVQEVKKLGRQAVAVRADVSKKQEVENLIDTTVNKFRRIDILVNNAAITRFVSLMDMTEEDWDTVLDVDLKGVFLCSQFAARHMVQQKYGKIVNISSLAGRGMVKAGPQGEPSYSAAKAGVIQLTKNFAVELGPYGINVNVIAPGLILTPLTYNGDTMEQLKQFMENGAKLAAIRRVGTPSDVANAALFLACSDSDFVTGSVIDVNGGRTQRM